MPAELLVLGSSAGIPTENRHTTALAMKIKGNLYLFDCGGPVSTMLKGMGEQPKEIQSLFLTHWHPDHASGLPMLLQDLQLSRRTQGFGIYGPQGTKRKVDLLQKMFFIPPDIYPFSLTTTEYDAGVVYEDEVVRVSSFQTRHLSGDFWAQLDEKYNHEMKPIAYGFVLEFDNKKIVISGDVLSSDDLIPVVKGADLVIHEFGHIKPEALSTFARQQNLRRLLITHIHHEWDVRDQELRDIISRQYPGEVEVAHDGMRIKL